MGVRSRIVPTGRGLVSKSGRLGDGGGRVTEDGEWLKPCNEFVLLGFGRRGVVVGQQRVAEDGHVEFAGVELREERLGEALVVVEDGDFDGRHGLRFVMIAVAGRVFQMSWLRFMSKFSLET